MTNQDFDWGHVLPRGNDQEVMLFAGCALAAGLPIRPWSSIPCDTLGGGHRVAERTERMRDRSAPDILHRLGRTAPVGNRGG